MAGVAGERISILRVDSKWLIHARQAINLFQTINLLIELHSPGGPQMISSDLIIRGSANGLRGSKRKKRRMVILQVLFYQINQHSPNGSV